MSVCECVYAWVHTVRDYGILYNSRPFVVPTPLLPVDSPNIATILVPPPSSFLASAYTLYAAQICEDIGTPFSLFFPALWLKMGLAGQMCHTISIVPPHFCSFTHQTRIHAAVNFQKLWLFVTWQYWRCFPHMILLLTEQALCTLIFAKQINVKIQTLLSAAHPILYDEAG